MHLRRWQLCQPWEVMPSEPYILIDKYQIKVSPVLNINKHLKAENGTNIYRFEENIIDGKSGRL